MANVLIACEYSGIVRDAFIAEGHNAISCDFLDSERPGPHIKGDVIPLLEQDWDMIIAHPPCTYLCNSGVRWLHPQEFEPDTGDPTSDEYTRMYARWDGLNEACLFFLDILNAPAQYIAVENPVMHRHAVERIGRKADFYVQPWMFGDNYKKRTGFHTKNLPPLTPTSTLDGSTAIAEVHLASPGPDRWKDRSRTYPGLAAAMAKQWGALL